MFDYNAKLNRWARGLLSLVIAGGVLTAAATAQVRVEAEAYAAAGSGAVLSPGGGNNGLGVETRDAVGKDGQNVSGAYLTYFRNTGNNAMQEFLEYNVTVPADGMYKIRMRAAYFAGNVTIRAWNLSYGPTFDNIVDMTPSGGMKAEHMALYELPFEMPMKQGVNRIRFYMINRGVNPDWWEFERTGDITQYGLVRGQVTDLDTNQPIAPAMVYADVLDAAMPGTVPVYGFQTVSDASGNYQLLLPNTSFSPYNLRVGAQAYSDPTGNVASVSVGDTSTTTVNLQVIRNNRYEMEWFNGAYTSPIANGRSAGTYDRASTSWNRLVAPFEAFGYHLTYTVTVPADGLYTFMLRNAPGSGSQTNKVRLTSSTGYESTLILPGVSGYNDFTFPTPIPLKAGENTLTIYSLDTLSRNLDYFVLTATGNPFGTVSGNVTNSATSAPEAGATVTLADPIEGIVARTTTDATGAYTLSAVPGTYDITVGKSGFDGGAGSSVTVTASAVTPANLTVTPSDTIVVLPEQMTDVYNGANEIPRFYGNYEWSPTGQTIGNLAADSWVEFPFYVAKPGMYNVTLDYSTAPLSSAHRTLSVDVRAEGSNQHFATRDTNAPPTADDYHTYVPLTLGDAVPLKAGMNILRVHNTFTLHNLAPRPMARSAGSINVGRITLERTADLPAMAPITGTVQSTALGTTVPDAMVLANPAGSEVPEPSRFWFNGYWTTTGANGQYTLDVPLGTYTVQAARPDNFTLPGASVPGVTVTATGATANLDLTSRWAGDTIRVEAEYYGAKIPEDMGHGSGPGVAMYVDPEASNGYSLAAFGAEDWVDLFVDVPAGREGQYDLSLVYYAPRTNVANPGSADIQIEVNDQQIIREPAPYTETGLTTPSTYTFSVPVTLKAGRNVIRHWVVGLSNIAYQFDAIELTRVVPMQMTRKALSIAGGLEAATGDDMTNLNVVTEGDSATVIDMLDAVELARQGK